MDLQLLNLSNPLLFLVHGYNVSVTEAETLSYPNQIMSFAPGIRVGRYVKNCGLLEACPANHYSLHLDTGYQNIILPTLCIDGKV